MKYLSLLISLFLFSSIASAQNLSGSEIGYELPPVGTYPVTFEEDVTISSHLTVSGSTLLVGPIGIGEPPPQEINFTSQATPAYPATSQ